MSPGCFREQKRINSPDNINSHDLLSPECRADLTDIFKRFWVFMQSRRGQGVGTRGGVSGWWWEKYCADGAGSSHVHTCTDTSNTELGWHSRASPGRTNTQDSNTTLWFRKACSLHMIWLLYTRVHYGPTDMNSLITGYTSRQNMCAP